MLRVSPDQIFSRERVSTRLIFLSNGLMLGTWAPLVPLAKQRLGADEGSLGLLLLCMGVGSLMSMPVAAVLAARFGCRVVTVVAVAALVFILPLLAVLSEWASLGLSLLFFGMMGAQAVAENLQAVLVERRVRRALMSGFHGLCSLGGIVGSAGVSGLLSLGVAPVFAAIVTSFAVALLLIKAIPGLLLYGDDAAEVQPVFVFPRGPLIVLGLLGLACCLAEGTVLDWSGVYLLTIPGVDVSLAGLGYATFAMAMTVGRLNGDRFRSIVGDARTLALGASVAAMGLLVTIFAPSFHFGLFGYLLIGLGLSNTVPVIFTLAGRSRSMSPGLGIASVSAISNLGILAGPAGVGFIAYYSDLRVAFGGLFVAMVLVAVSARWLTALSAKP